jgi:NAD(P)-dependent dehydrogenase (short-subunit alcohol dehydrogenase family)
MCRRRSRRSVTRSPIARIWRRRLALEDLAAQALAEFGRIDVLCANAGIATYGSIADSSHELWDEVIAVNLTGVWNSIKAVLPSMRERRYGRVIVTSSSVARHPVPNLGPYTAAKAGLVSLIKALSMEHFREGITANAVAPAIVKTKIVMNEANYKIFVPDVEHPTEAEALEAWQRLVPYGDATLEPEAITDGVLFLASPAADKISGICLDIQAGWNAETPV